jgi:outer membrane protein TolC
MKRWIAALLSIALIQGIGCQRIYLPKEAIEEAQAGLPANLDNDPGVAAPTGPTTTGSPANVDFPDREAYYISLEEAIARGLESGTASARGGAGQGLVDDNLVTNTGGGSLNNQVDTIRILALNPAIQNAAMEQSLARFDAVWVSAANWTVTDNLQQGLSSFNNGQTVAVSSSIVKGLPTGGVSNISFITNYQALSTPPAGAFGVLNPQYTTSVQFGFEQPLWRDYGVEINQLLNRLPSIGGSTMPSAAAGGFNARQTVSQQQPSYTGTGTEGILVARTRLDASKAEFERNLNGLVLNVEVAYWRLYQAYGRLYAYEEVLRIAHKAWIINQAKYTAGTVGPAVYHPIRAQYEEFRGERVSALGAVLEAERNLRGLMGLPMEDGRRLVPVTAPTLAPYQPNWDAAIQDALFQRPELSLARDNLRLAQYNLQVAKNFLKPDLRFTGYYQPIGFGTRLDGDGTFVDGAATQRPSNAFRSLSSGDFNNWSMGLTLSVPIGFRFENAAVRASRLALAQSYYLLKDQEDRATRSLTQQYQKLAEWYRLIETRRAERKAYAEAVEARFREFAAGKTTVADFLLDSQRRLATAQVKEYEAISEYNNTLARFEWAKGNILKHNNVVISEGQLPAGTGVRAVEHERERTQATVLRERPLPFLQPGRMVGDVNGNPTVVNLDEGPLAPAPAQANPPAAVVPNGNLNFQPGQPGQPRQLPSVNPVSGIEPPQ